MLFYLVLYNTTFKIIIVYQHNLVTITRNLNSSLALYAAIIHFLQCLLFVLYYSKMTERTMGESDNDMRSLKLMN